MSLLKTTLLSLSVLAFSFIGTLFLYQALAFAVPGSAAPAGNVSLPLNVSSDAQTKQGPLGANTFYDANNSSYFFKPAGTSKLGGTLDLSSNPIKNVQDPVDPQDVATKAYVDDLAALAGRGFYETAIAFSEPLAAADTEGRGILTTADNLGNYFAVYKGSYGLAIDKFNPLDKKLWSVSIDFTPYTGGRSGPDINGGTYALSPDFQGGLYILIKSQFYSRTGFLVHVRNNQSYLVTPLYLSSFGGRAMFSDYLRLRVLPSGEVYLGMAFQEGYGASLKNWSGMVKVTEAGKLICKTPFIKQSPHMPSDIDSAGNIYSSNWWGNILKFDKDCNFIKEIKPSSSSIYYYRQILVDNLGNILAWAVRKGGSQYFLKLSPDGQELWAAPVSQYAGAALDLASNNDLVVAYKQSDGAGALFLRFNSSTGKLIGVERSTQYHYFQGGPYPLLSFDKYGGIVSGLVRFSPFSWSGTPDPSFHVSVVQIPPVSEKSIQVFGNPTSPGVCYWEGGSSSPAGFRISTRRKLLFSADQFCRQKGFEKGLITSTKQWYDIATYGYYDGTKWRCNNRGYGAGAREIICVK